MKATNEAFCAIGRSEEKRNWASAFVGAMNREGSVGRNKGIAK